jgi:ribosomal protein L37AE/L43A
MSVACEYQIEELLELARAHPRGRRHDCPKCGALRTITHTDDAFFCHKCGWKGNAVSLAKELGLYRRLPSAEYRELRRKQERAHEAALRLYQATHERQLELQDELRDLGLTELSAHKCGPIEEAWDVLADVYSRQPAVERELDLLESGNAQAVYSQLVRSDK